MVERDGREVRIPIAVEFIEEMIKDKKFPGLIKPRCRMSLVPSQKTALENP